MKKRIILIIVFMLISFGIANAEYKFAENWSKTDTAWQVTFIGITAVDWVQTRWMAKQDWQWDGEYYHETNFILGDHPDSKDVDLYMPLAMIGHTLIAIALPPEVKVFDYKINPRRIWQGVWIATEAGVVTNNFIIGAKFEY